MPENLGSFSLPCDLGLCLSDQTVVLTIVSALVMVTIMTAMVEMGVLMV